VNIRDYPRPSVTVDLVVFTIIDAQLRVLLVKRKVPPFKGGWALPGGFVRVGEGNDQGEDLDAAARRELEEETGLSPDRVFLEQLYTFGKANRDPRMRVITVAYYALVRPDLAPLVKAGGDVSDVEWFEIGALKKMELAFDHRDIINSALERVRGKLEYTDICFELVPLTFTIPELRHVFAVVTGKEMDPGNFRRRFNRMMENGVLEKAPGKRITVSKPATVYRFNRAS
jgi:8-oxo-dGTP diphosphatase